VVSPLKTEPTAAGLSADDAALIAQGGALDAEAAPPLIDAATGQPIAPTDYGTEAAMLVSTLVLIAAPFYPSIKKIWTKEKQTAVAAALAPVMEEEGFSLGDFMGKYGNKMTLLIVAGPLVLETIDGVKADRAAAKAGAKPAPTAAPGADLTGADFT
jgi:hypothetical protein